MRDRALTYDPAMPRVHLRELYFGATSGAVFGSGDAGESWFDAAAHLPPVLSVSGA